MESVFDVENFGIRNINFARSLEAVLGSRTMNRD